MIFKNRLIVTIVLGLILKGPAVNAESKSPAAEKRQHEEDCRLVVQTVYADFKAARDKTRRELQPLVDGAHQLLGMITPQMYRLIRINRGDLVFPKLAKKTSGILPGMDVIRCEKGKPSVSDDPINGEKLGILECVLSDASTENAKSARVFVIQSSGKLVALDMTGDSETAKYGEGTRITYGSKFGLSFSIAGNPAENEALLKTAVSDELDEKSGSWADLFKKNVGMGCDFVDPENPGSSKPAEPTGDAEAKGTQSWLETLPPSGGTNASSAI